MIDWLKKHFLITRENTVVERAKTPSVEDILPKVSAYPEMPPVKPPKEEVGEPASLLIWSLENEPERWENGKSVCLGDYTLLDKNTGRSHAADFYEKRYRCTWMTYHERLEVGKAIVKRCKSILADANVEYVKEEKEQMFKDFGRNPQ